MLFDVSAVGLAVAVAGAACATGALAADLTVVHWNDVHAQCGLHHTLNASFVPEAQRTLTFGPGLADALAAYITANSPVPEELVDVEGRIVYADAAADSKCAGTVPVEPADGPSGAVPGGYGE
eukprot:jgi/Ulvmu1/8403/UM042_0110.1